MGRWEDALRRALWRRVPEILQSLRDDRAGLVVLDRKRRNAALKLLALVMPAEAIRRELELGGPVVGEAESKGSMDRAAPVKVAAVQPTGYRFLH